MSQGITLLSLMLLLFYYTEGIILRGGLSLGLLCLYHLLADRNLSDRGRANEPPMWIHLAIYLALCSLTIWATTGDDESSFWLVYILPITLAASRLSLPSTLIISALSGALLFLFSTPAIFRPNLDLEEFAEICSFSLSFFVVGILVQSYSAQIRARLVRERELNEELRGRQTELQASLSELKDARESLRRKEALAALGELSARLAHEIRNPLGIISSSAELLGKRMEDSRSRQLLTIIQEENARLNALISDFLTFGRPLPPKLQSFEIVPLIRSCLPHISELAAERGVRLQDELPQTAAAVVADPDMVRQILLNLLLNALDATPSGGNICIRLKQNQSKMQLEVEDDGVGIAQDQLGLIFNPFFTSKDKGTGLGLSNAYKMAEAHGGDLHVHSVPGQGSCFTLTIPARKA